MSGPVSPLSFERYELKYLIPLSLVEPISKFVEARCDMDYYSQISPDNYYTINSLYLDTPNFYLLRFKEMAGAYNFNMRIRSYGHEPKPPYFFEIKYKIHEFVRKNRTQIHNDDWAEILNGAEIPINLDVDSAKHLDDFLYMRWTYNVEPLILTQYRRKAYISFIDDYARVTFDRDLRFQEMREWSVRPDEKMLCHYDHPGSFESPGENVILELKCEKKIPVWFIDLIQHFRLEGGSFSKFGNSVATMFEQTELMRPGSLYL